MLKLISISKTFNHKKVKAITDINLSLPDSGFVAIIGESGSGKSTLISLISGIDKPDKGKIIYCDGKKEYSYKKTTHLHYIRKNILTTVLQENLFIDGMKIRENIFLASGVQGIEREQNVNEKINTLLKKTKLTERVAHSPQEVSGGQRQRATLVRGLARKSSIILADEPTASQDEESEIILFDLLRNEANDKLVVLVTHSRSLAKKYCDRIIELRDGVVIADFINNPSPEESIVNNHDGSFILHSSAYPNMVEWKEIERELDCRGKIVLEKKKCEINSSSNKDLSDTDNQYPTPGKCSFFSIGSVFKRVYLQSLPKLLVLFFICGLLISLLGGLLTFSRYDTTHAMYRMYLENGYKSLSLINTRNRNNGNGGFQPAFDEIENLYGCRVMELIDFTVTSDNPYIIPTDTEAGQFFGFRCCSEGEVKLVFGNYCSGDSVMITDFAADSILRNGKDEYSSYEDIIGKGLELSGSHFNISGIISTDYAGYIDFLSIDKPDEETKRKVNDFKCLREDYYLRLFISRDTITKARNGESFIYIPVNNRMTLTEVRVDASKTDYNAIVVSVNKKLADELGMSGNNSVAKLDNYPLDSEFVNDGESHNVLYVSQELYSGLILDGLGSFSCVLPLEGNEEALAYLMRKQFSVRNAISQTVEKISDLIHSISSVIMIIMMIGTTIVVFCILLLPFSHAGRLRRAVGLLRLWGAGFKEILLLVSMFGISYLIGIICFTIIDYCVLSNVFSSVLSAVFKIKLSVLVNPGVDFWLYLGAILTAVIIIGTIIDSLLKCTRKIIKQLR